LAGIYDGTNWILYHNGKQVATAASTVGAQSIDGGQWAIGSQGLGEARFFNGAISDVQIYNKAITAAAVTKLATGGTAASSPVGQWKLDQLVNNRTLADSAGGNTGYVGNGKLDGRLVQIQDHNGLSVDLAYNKTFTDQQLIEAPDRQWQLDTVTDSHGRQAKFTYQDQQVSGHWVISKIDLPSAGKTRSLQYTYLCPCQLAA